MTKISKLLKITFIILLLPFVCMYKANASTPASTGKNFILPKTFKINDEYLPPLNAKPEIKLNKPVITGNSTVKTIKKATTTKTVKPAEIKKTVVIKSEKVIQLPPKTVAVQTKKEIPVTFTQRTTKQAQIQLPQKTITQIKTANVKPAVSRTPVKTPVAQAKSIPAVLTTSAPNTPYTPSLTNLVKSYNYSYSDTLKSAIISLSSMEIIPVSYNSDRGQIIAKLSTGKEIFILVVPFTDNYTCVRITPTDGDYELPMSTINQIFSAIGYNLKTI